MGDFWPHFPPTQPVPTTCNIILQQQQLLRKERFKIKTADRERRHVMLAIRAPPPGVYFVLPGILISRRIFSRRLECILLIKLKRALTSATTLCFGYFEDSCYPGSLSFRANVNMSLPSKVFNATALPSTGKNASITSPTASFWYTMYPIVQDHMRLKTSSPNNKPLNKKQL